MAAPSRKTRMNTGFLPRGAIEFFRRRLIQAGGVALLVFGLAVATALVTADSHDPSFNTAAAEPVLNALGWPGAYLADFLFQAVGWGGLLLALTGAVWGSLLLFRMRLPGGWRWRLALLPPAMVVWAVGLAALPLPNPAGLPAGVGGALGQVMVGGLTLLLPPEIGWIAGPAALVLGLAATVFVLGLSGGDWANLGRRSLEMAVATGHVASSLRRQESHEEPPRRGEPVLRPMPPPAEAGEEDEDDPFVPRPESDEEMDLPLPPPGSLVQPKRPPARATSTWATHPLRVTSCRRCRCWPPRPSRAPSASARMPWPRTPRCWNRCWRISASTARW